MFGYLSAHMLLDLSVRPMNESQEMRYNNLSMLGLLDVKPTSGVNP